jgi:hypothetical protein
MIIFDLEITGASVSVNPISVVTARIDQIAVPTDLPATCADGLVILLANASSTHKDELSEVITSNT